VPAIQIDLMRDGRANARAAGQGR